LGIYKVTGDEPLFADWGTQELVVPEGKLLSRDILFSKYERTTCIRVENGFVQNVRIIHNSNNQQDNEV